MEEQSSIQDTQVLAATLMSELAYRAAECDFYKLQTLNADLQGALPSAAPLTLQRVEVAPGGQRYLVGSTPTALYVAFQGTKALRDWLANLNIGTSHIEGSSSGQQPHSSSTTRSSSSAGGAVGAESEVQEELTRGLADAAPLNPAPAATYPRATAGTTSATPGVNTSSHQARAHRGFWRRALSIPVADLQQEAAAAGRSLVLCGHSLGGAVATLCTLRLLSQASTAQHAAASSSQQQGQPQPAVVGSTAGAPVNVSCIAFAAPPVANKALVKAVQERGWYRHLVNLVLPEDPVVKLAHRLLQGKSEEAESVVGTAPADPTTTTTSSSGSQDMSSSKSDRGWATTNSIGSPSSLGSPSSVSSSDYQAGPSSPSSSSSGSVGGKKARRKLFGSLSSSMQDMQAYMRDLLLGEESPGSHLVTLGDASGDDAWLDSPTAASTSSSGWLLPVGSAGGDGTWSDGSSSACHTPSSTCSRSSGGDWAEATLLSPSNATGHSSSSNSSSAQHSAAGAPTLWQLSSPTSSTSSRDGLTKDQAVSPTSAYSGDALELLSLKHLAAAAAAQAVALTRELKGGSELALSTSPHGHQPILEVSPVDQSWLVSAAAASPPVSRPLGSTSYSDNSKGCPLAAHQQGLVLTTLAAVARPAAAAALRGPTTAGLLRAAVGHPLMATAANGALRLGRFPAARQLLRRAWNLKALAGLSRTAALGAMRAAAAAVAPPLLPFMSAVAMASAAVAAWPVAGALLSFAGQTAAGRMVPRHYPLGHQWVVTAAGVMPVTPAQLLQSFSPDLSQLDVSGLGGLFPAHRMIAYRRRMTQVLQLQAPPLQHQEQQ